MQAAIVLIPGLWVTPRRWEKWVERYESRGYRVFTPAYSGLEVEALRQAPRTFAFGNRPVVTPIPFTSQPILACSV
jgi:hypothetical protein